MSLGFECFIFLLLASGGFGDSSKNNSMRKRLVLLHDHTFTIQAQVPSKTDILGFAIFSSVATTFDLDLFTYLMQYENAFFSVDWDSENVVAVISIGACHTNAKVSSLAKDLGVFVFPVNTTPCREPGGVQEHSVPIYQALDSRKFQCLAPEVSGWISGRVWRKSNKVFGKDLTDRDYHSEYLDCIGTDGNIEALLSSSSPEVKASLPFSLKIEQGKRFLNGREMVIATINRPPFLILTVEGGEIVEAKGFCITMLDVLATKFNFTYHLVLPYDGNWGNPMENGTFNGMVGMVHRKEVDFAVAGFTITQIRDTVIDFTHAFYEEPTTILIPTPKEEDKLFAFLSPYTWEVWTTLLGAVGVISPTMWFLASKCLFLPLLYPHTQQTERPPLHRYIWDCAFTLVTQSNRMRQTFPARVLLGVWWMVNIILIYTYTSNLIAFLTVPKLQNLIESLEELSNQREILWTYRAGTAHESLFGDAPAPGTYYKIGELIREQPNLIVTTNYEGVNAVLTKNMAFIKEKSWLDFAMEEDYLNTGQCRLSQVPQIFFSAGFGWVLQEESIYLPLFNIEILRMSQSGLFAEWRRRFWPKPNECTSRGGFGGSGPRPLELKNFYGHFLILGFGFLLSFAIFLVERTTHPRPDFPEFIDSSGKILRPSPIMKVKKPPRKR